MQKAISMQGEKNAFYTAGGSYNINTYELLLQFRIANNIYFPLAIKDELGFRFLSNFFNNFVFIGKYNRIIGTLDFDTSLEEIDVMLKRTMSSFYDLYLRKSKDVILLTDDIIEINLTDYFNIGDPSIVDLLVKNTTNPGILSYTFSGNKLLLERKAVKGFTNMSVIAKIRDKDIYTQTDFEIINPTSIYEDFELNNISESDMPWIFSGREKWYISTEEAYLNNKSIVSGPVREGEISGIGLDLDMIEPGILIFAYKTSTRPYFDRLKFYFDGVEISASESSNLWSGENDWRLMYFTVRAGKRSFRWEYVKGTYSPYNRDKVWLDLVVIPDKLNGKYNERNSADALSAFPNPFNPSTTVSFDLKENSETELLIFDTKGRQVAEIFRGELKKGNHSFRFDASHFSSGVYYSVLKYGGNISTSRLILAK